MTLYLLDMVTCKNYALLILMLQEQVLSRDAVKIIKFFDPRPKAKRISFDNSRLKRAQ